MGRQENVSIFGDTPTNHFQNDEPLKLWKNENYIGIDCGCGYDYPGRLCCLRLDDILKVTASSLILSPVRNMGLPEQSRKLYTSFMSSSNTIEITRPHLWLIKPEVILGSGHTKKLKRASRQTDSTRWFLMR